MSFGKRRILIVDNDKNWWHQQRLQIMLEIINFDVTYQEGYDQAVESIINNTLAPFDILITEIKINQEAENKSGFQLVSYLDQKKMNTKVIILTRYGTIEHTKQALQNPRIHDIGLKSPDDGSEFDVKKFVEIVNNALKEFIDTDILVLSLSNILHHQKIYSVIQSATNELKRSCKHVNDLLTGGSVLEQTVNNIQRAKIIIADLTSKKSDVYFNAGISNAKEKPLILLASDENIIESLSGYHFIAISNPLTANEAKLLKRAIKKQVEIVLNNGSNYQRASFDYERKFRKFFLIITAKNNRGEDVFKSIIRSVTIERQIEGRYIWNSYQPVTAKSIESQIRLADLIITDLTEDDADAYYLSGFAFGLGKPLIIMQDKDKYDEMPSSIKNSERIMYIMYQKDTEDHRDEAKREISRAIRPYLRVSIFMNYIEEDRLIVQNISHELRKYDWIDIWDEKEDLLAGKNRESTIDETIKKVDAVLVCISKRSINKISYTQAEIRKALEQQSLQPENSIHIIPILLERCNTPGSLKGLESVDITKSNAIEKIINSLDTLRK